MHIYSIVMFLKLHMHHVLIVIRDNINTYVLCSVYGYFCFVRN